MKTIIVRAWDEDLKQMLPSVDLTGPRSTYKWLGTKDVLIEQSTGLLDKNGKEIYEGDILRYEDGYNGIVEWRFGGLLIMKPDGTWCAITDRWHVIGNIHENHDLLIV